jgi:hypothetical protein
VGFKDRPLSCLVLSEFGKTVSMIKGDTMDVDAHQAKVTGQFSCGLCEKEVKQKARRSRTGGGKDDKSSQRT